LRPRAGLESRDMIPRQGPRPCLHARRAIELGRGGRGEKAGRGRRAELDWAGSRPRDVVALAG